MLYTLFHLEPFWNSDTHPTLSLGTRQRFIFDLDHKLSTQEAMVLLNISLNFLWRS